MLCFNFRTYSKLPSGKFWLGIFLVAVVLVLVTGGNQSPLLVLRLILKFENAHKHEKISPNSRIRYYEKVGVTCENHTVFMFNITKSK